MQAKVKCPRCGRVVPTRPIYSGPTFQGRRSRVEPHQLEDRVEVVQHDLDSIGHECHGSGEVVNVASAGR